MAIKKESTPRPKSAQCRVLSPLALAHKNEPRNMSNADRRTIHTRQPNDRCCGHIL